MSLLLKNELRLRLGPQHCDAAIWRAGFRPRPVGQASVSGQNGESLEIALGTLVSEGHELPSRAALWVEDEYLYTLMLPADKPWSNANDAARAHFVQMLGHRDLQVQTSLAPCGARWIAVALESALLDQWREILTARGVEVQHVRSALLEDLVTLREELRGHVGLAILVRREGASVIRLSEETISHIDWERCDVTDTDQLAARIEAHGLQHVHETASDDMPAVCIVPFSTSQRALLEGMCADHGWKLCRAIHGLLA